MHTRYLSSYSVALALAVFVTPGCKKNDSDRTPAVAADGATREGASAERPDDDEKVVNVYSHRHYDADKKLYDTFTEKTGIKVKVVKANADELIERMKTEGQRSPADLFLAADAGRLVRAENAGVLQPLDNELLEQRIPAHLRAPDGSWFGVSKRARVLVYDKTRPRPELSTYEALANDPMIGKILVRSGTNIYNQSLLASLIAHHGVDKAEAWARGVVTNMAREPKGSDRDQMKALAAGEGKVAIVNSYYVGLLVDSDVPEEHKVGQKMAVFFPNQNDRGAHVNVSGAGLAKHAPHRENAIELLEFLVSDEAQRIFVEDNNEFPVVEGIELSELLESWGDFTEDELSLARVGENNDEAVKIFDRVGWR